MIESIYVKNCLSFKEIKLDFKPGLIVFTGPSGAGKSVLMNSFVSLLGIGESHQIQSELTLNFPYNIENYESEDGQDIIKQLRKDKNKFYLNDFSISKKKLKEVSKEYISIMAVRDYTIFEKESILNIIDGYISKKEGKCFLEVKDKYIKEYIKYKKEKNKYEELLKQEQEVEERKEYLEYEVKKLKELNPTTTEEYEELAIIKKQIVQKDEIMEKINKTYLFIEEQNNVYNFLDIVEKDSTFLDETMSTIEIEIEKAKDRFEELKEIEIDEVLTRLEQLSKVRKKYGTVEEGKETLIKKEEELTTFQNYDESLIKQKNILNEQKQIIIEENDKINKKRKQNIKEIETNLNKYLKMLYLESTELIIEESTEYNESGNQEILIKLNNTNLEKISSGEFNRLKLGLMVLKSENINTNGILILDEIDANLSGKESESIGKLLFKLSKNYQIFSISHQPQLTAYANQHFLIEKSNNISMVKELETEEKEQEIARMISGEVITKESLVFSKTLLKEIKEIKEIK